MATYVLVGIGAAAFYLLLHPGMIKWRMPLYVTWLCLAASMILVAIGHFASEQAIFNGIVLIVLAAASLLLLLSVDPEQMNKLLEKSKQSQAAGSDSAGSESSDT